MRDGVQVIVRVLAASLLVGLVLAWLDIDPTDLLRGAWDAVLAAPRALGDAVGWAVPYVLKGAVVVVPLVALGAVLRLLQRRRRPPPGREPPQG
ncbi:hypothetical protein [Oleisolibacter albus]|uniref:hypothetical protein n=1 Tax=Oleisolibacter albus TaxID=2171757 RepID=UPI000DF15C34|nr:hypothetical protein [Oleisolibacter albus]